MKTTRNKAPDLLIENHGQYCGGMECAEERNMAIVHTLNGFHNQASKLVIIPLRRSWLH